MDSVALPSGYSSARLNFRVDNRHSASRRSYRYTGTDGKEYSRKNPPWALFLSDTDGHTCWITVAKNDVPDNDLAPDTSGPAITVSIDSVTSRYDIAEKQLPFSGETLWNVEISKGALRIVAGATQPSEIATQPLPLKEIASFGFASSPGGEILISDITLTSLTTSPFATTSTSPATSPEESTSHSSSKAVASNPPTSTSNPASKDAASFASTSSDPLEGTYEIFDRTLDESLLRLGGEYKLAVVKNHDRYDIIYIAGARINGNRWKTGMLKGILTPTSFDGIYNLKWFDSEGEPLSHSITAQSGYGGTLTLQFPYHSSTIRLRKTN
ncbi:MAG: hypothetical protein K2K95_08675 [Muribaculaceae bacterium]|nr:hypothetical protein [Muribaculaceae bacterium]